MDRRRWARKIERLDPETEYHEIARILSTLEFPWDTQQALSLALFRTYAVPSIGRLLHRTGEFTERTQKRYDDTGLLLDAILNRGFDHPDGRAALRRMNQMHRMYDISNEDLRYVLCTFVVVPLRWLDAYGWRRLTEPERRSIANYYRDLGQHMNIEGVPETHQEFTELMDNYEREHFAYDEGARAVADATLSLVTTFPPNHRAPARLVKRFSRTLMDERLLDALGYPHPNRLERAVGPGALRLRARFVGFLPPRSTPLLVENLSHIRSYPGGYDVRDLGTFTPTAGCPVPHEQTG